jgi:phosphoglycolate phosphatase
VYNIIVAYKAVLFDLDGTLLDTLQYITDSTDVALAKFGFPGHDLQTYRGFMGTGMAALAIKALPESFHNPDAVSQLLVNIGKEYAVRWTVHTPIQGFLNCWMQSLQKGLRWRYCPINPMNLY